jgi:hypothetical protein
MSCPSQSSWLDQPNDIWWGVQSIKLFFMQPPPLPSWPFRVLQPQISTYLSPLSCVPQTPPTPSSHGHSYNIGWKTKVTMLPPRHCLSRTFAATFQITRSSPPFPSWEHTMPTNSFNPSNGVCFYGEGTCGLCFRPRHVMTGKNTENRAE